MSRYKKTFSELKEQERMAFIPFWMLGDPNLEKSQEIIEIIAKNSDILELGLPFSDPLADGKTIQDSANRALEAGATTEKCLKIVANIRKKFPTKPIGLLVYFNLILSYQNKPYQEAIKLFFAEAKQAGVDSILIPELPIEEVEIVENSAKDEDIDLIFLVSTNTPEHRVQQILAKSSGFLYAVATPGITGAKTEIAPETIDMIQRLKSQTDLPICIGFGISSPEHLRILKQNQADGGIIGSKLFQFRENLADLEKFCKECYEVC